MVHSPERPLPSFVRTVCGQGAAHFSEGRNVVRVHGNALQVPRRGERLPLSVGGLGGILDRGAVARGRQGTFGGDGSSLLAHDLYLVHDSVFLFATGGDSIERKDKRRTDDSNAIRGRPSLYLYLHTRKPRNGPRRACWRVQRGRVGTCPCIRHTERDRAN